MDGIAGAEDIWFHFRVPPAHPMTEVYARVNQLADERIIQNSTSVKRNFILYHS